MSESKPIRFFLGANTPQGFYSLFDEIEVKEQPWHSFLIKGGPGCGKSSFLKKVASLYHPLSAEMELCPCSSDPKSLDAVILPELQLSLMDATAPHCRDATVPALRHELLSFGDFLHPASLSAHRQEIEQLLSVSPSYYQSAVAYLRAAQVFLSHSFQLAACAVDREKVERYAKQFAAKNFKHTASAAVEKRRFLSSICSDGIVVLEDSPARLCRKLYLIEDDYGAVTQELLTSLRQKALLSGQSIISCYCPMDPDNKLEHLLIPSAGVGFLRSNHFHSMKNSMAQRKIHARRFQNHELLSQNKQRFAYNRKAAQLLLEQAIAYLGETRQIHDRLEELYSPAMDFAALNAAYPQFLRRIHNAVQIENQR